MCFVRISEQTANFALDNIKRLVFITEVESVYCSVRTESLYNTDTFHHLKVNIGSTPCSRIILEKLINSPLGNQEISHILQNP